MRNAARDDESVVRATAAAAAALKAPLRPPIAEK